MISQAANARRPLEPATKGYKNVLFKLFYISYNLLDYYLKSIIYEWPLFPASPKRLMVVFEYSDLQYKIDDFWLVPRIQETFQIG